MDNNLIVDAIAAGMKYAMMAMLVVGIAIGIIIGALVLLFIQWIL